MPPRNLIEYRVRHGEIIQGAQQVLQLGKNGEITFHLTLAVQ